MDRQHTVPWDSVLGKVGEENSIYNETFLLGPVVVFVLGGRQIFLLTFFFWFVDDLKLEHVFQIAVQIINKYMQYRACLDATAGNFPSLFAHESQRRWGDEATKEVTGLVGSLWVMMVFFVFKRVQKQTIIYLLPRKRSQLVHLKMGAPCKKRFLLRNHHGFRFQGSSLLAQVKVWAGASPRYWSAVHLENTFNPVVGYDVEPLS